MRRQILLGAVALSAALIGSLTGWTARRPPNATSYAGMHLVAVQAHLDEAPPDYVFLAGDSHAELQPGAQRPCGLALVNGGISGASTAVYADLLGTLTFPIRPRAAVLTLGTNDILAKRKPRSSTAASRFEEAVERVVRRLSAVADRVVVTALPPIGRALAEKLDAAAIPDYSQRLRRLCDRLGCLYADPFAEARDGDGGFAKAGAMRDELHLKRYGPALKSLEADLCR